MAKPKVARPKTDEKYTSPQAGAVQNNSNRALELGETYRRLGGTDTALLPNYARMNPLPDASIPVLERAILDTANTLQGRASINRTGDKQPLDMSNVSPLNAFLQGATGLNRASERNRLQQTDRAVDEIRNARTEQILSDIGQSDRFNSFREHPILAEQSLVGLLTGRTSLTPEMREAGLTQTDINTYLDEIKNEGIRTGSRELAEDHPALATVASIGLNPLYALTNSVKNVGNYVAGNPLENYINPANELRQNVSEGIDSKVGQFAYNVGNSAADMLTAMLLPGSAAGTMGLEKASEVINGAVDRGLTPDQILAEGIGSGVTTAATEAIPLGRFSQGGNVFGAMLAEGLQEGSEDIADTILDQLVTQLGGNANRSELITQLRAYLDAGYSPDDAVNAVKADYFKQLGLDVLAGGITGGLMGAGSNALQGRNIITGNIPSLNNETQTEVNETIPEVTQPEAQPVEQQTVNEVPLTEDEEVHNAEQRIMNFVYGLQRGTVADPRAEYNNVLADVEAVKAKYPNAASWLDTMLFINQPTINQKLNLFQPETSREEFNPQPVEALNSPLENAQQMVDNFSNSLKNGSIQSREQASQGLQNISQALNAIAEQNPEIRSDIKTMWDNFIQSITPQRNQPTEEVGNTDVANSNQQTENLTSIPDEVHNYVRERTAIWNRINDAKNSGINIPPEEVTQAIRSMNAMDGYMYDNYPEWINSDGTFKMDEYNRLNSVQPETQPVAEEIVQPEGLTDRQITEYRSQRDAINSNLAMFKGTKKLQNRLDKAFNAIEQNQPNAVENFNNVVNEINEEMAGETIGVSQRDVMSDLYRDMKEVTDGYKIRVSKDAIRQLGLSNDTYNELKNRLYTGKNSITFVEKGGTPIDSAYMEMYDQAHGSLPSPQNMAEGDLLKALYKYITDAKSSRGETAMETAWENLPVNATTPLNRGQDLINGFYNKMRSGKATGVDTYDLQEKILDIIKQNPEYKEELADLCNKAIDDFWNNGIDPEVANLNTVEDVQNATDEEMEQWNSRPFDLEYFREIEDEAIPTLDEDEYHSGVFKTSKFSTNTAPNSEIMTEEQIDEIIPEDIKNYEAVTHEGTLNAAERNVRENGFKGTFANLKSKEQWDAVNTDEAMLCFKRAADEANALEKRGQNSKDAWKRAVDIFKEIRERATVGGQMIEALKKWSIKTPEGKLAQAIAYATDATKSGTDNDSWLGQLKDLGKVEKFTFSDEFVEEFLKKAHEYDGQDITDGQQARLDQELAHMVLDQIPRTFREKFTSLWMDNLLASVRTLFTRNVGGNTGKALLDQTITKWISGGVDKAAARLTGSRTTTGFTLKGLQTYLKGAKEGAINTTRDYWLPTSDPDAEQTFSQLLKDIRSLNKEDVKANIFAEANVSNRKGSEGDFKETLRNNRTSFDSKPLKLYDKIIKFGLAFSDNPFFRGTYEQTYEELQQLRKEGLIPEVSDERFEPWAKACAVAQGLEAVYQDNSKLAEGASKIKQGLSDMSEGYVGADILSGAAMPFVRTPMNVVRSNLEYSPLGVAKNLLATIKEVRANLKEGRNAFDTKNFKQERFVRETSRNIVGTLMFAMGLMMKGAGFLTGGYSDNEKERQAQKESGMQEYALVNPLNGNQYSINWIPGLGANWVSASAFEDAFSRPDQTVGEALGSGIKEGSASMFEQAALQGLQRLTGATNYNSDSIIDNAVQTVANTASSAVVPAFVRQTAAALDPYKRDTFSGNVYEDILDNAINGIPFLRQQLLEPRIGSNGQPMVQNPGRNTAQKWFDNLVNPAMVTSPSAVSDPVREEAMRLFDETRSYDAFQPYNKMDYLEVGDHVPTREEFAEFQQRANTAMNEIASNMIESDFYRGLDAVDQQTILKNIYDAVRQGERAEILGLDENDLKGAAKAYYEDGEEGLINYLTAGSALNQMGLNNNPSYRDQIIETLNQGGTEAVEQMVSDSQDLSALGFSDNMVFKYNHAQQYIPTLNPQSFSDLYHAIDTEDPEKESIKQSELLAYLNQNPTSYDYDTVMSYWNAFGNWTRTPYFDENSGAWKVSSSGSSSSQTSNVDSIGQYGRGNIDLYNRPQLINPDGSVSTVSGMSFGEDGLEILVPTIAYDSQGRPYRMSDQEAIDRYHQTGEYLGKFNSVREANEYAELLHQQQEQLYAR